MCPYVEHGNKGLWARVFASSAIVSVSDGVWGGGQRHSDKLHESRIFSEINLFTHESTSDESLRNSLLLGRTTDTQQPKLQQLIKMVIYSDGLGLRHTHTHHIIWPPDVYQPKVQLSIVVPKLTAGDTNLLFALQEPCLHSHFYLRTLLIIMMLFRSVLLSPWDN